MFNGLFVEYTDLISSRFKKYDVRPVNNAPKSILYCVVECKHYNIIKFYLTKVTFSYMGYVYTYVSCCVLLPLE